MDLQVLQGQARMSITSIRAVQDLEADQAGVEAGLLEAEQRQVGGLGGLGEEEEGSCHAAGGCA